MDLLQKLFFKGGRATRGHYSKIIAYRLKVPCLTNVPCHMHCHDKQVSKIFVLTPLKFLKI